MNHTDRHDEDDDFAGLEASLKSLRPRAPSERFADAVATESFLASLTPKPVSPDFNDIVAAECLLSGLAPKALPEGFADRVAAGCALGDVSPRDLPEDFVARVATEIALGELVTPCALPAGYADRVVAACLAGERAPGGVVIPFRRYLVPLSAAAALGLAALPFVLRPNAVVPAPATVASAAPAIAGEPLDADGVSLPVVTLPDGRAYRPVIRNRYAQPVDFRVTPCGAAMPVSTPASGTGVDYEPVMFE